MPAKFAKSKEPAMRTLVTALIAAAFTALLVTVTASLAQTSSSAAEMLTRDQVLGPGCNEIGLGFPSQNQPLMPEQEWLDAHSVCVEGRLKAGAMCYGLTDGTDQIELCMFMTAEGDESMDIGCSDMFLDTESGAYGPHPDLTDSVLDQFRAVVEERNLGFGGLLYPCTITPRLASNTMVFAAFDGLTPTTEPVVLRVNVETGASVAIIADEPTIDYGPL